MKPPGAVASLTAPSRQPDRLLVHLAGLTEDVLVDPLGAMLLAIYAVPIGIGVGAPLYVRFRRRARRERIRSWALARGFTEEEDILRGKLDDDQVEISLAEPSRAIASILIRPSLDLGLWLQPGHWPDPLALQRVHLRDVEFDSEIEVFGMEAARVRAVLSPKVRAAILACAADCEGYLLNDERMSVWLHGKEMQGEILEDRLADASAVVRRIERRRHKAPVAAELETYLPDWAVFSSRHDLELSRAPLGLQGSFRGRDVWAVAVRRGFQDHLLDVLAWFDPPLGFPISVRPSDSIAELAELAGQLGARVKPQASKFERVFEVQAADDRAQLLLDGGIAQALLKTQIEHGDTTLTSEWLWVRVGELPTDPADALSAMEAVAELAHEIAVRARQLHAGGHGPYRGRQ